ncbi:MAG TPA: rhomboid family intramembrane serine protease [Chitinophaga sp.]
MEPIGIINIVLIIINVVVTYRGLKDRDFFDKYAFQVDKIILHKEYKRLITSGFLHVNWMHLIFNMLSLYLFSDGVELYLGSTKFLVIYFASLVGGDLFSLLVHRRHGDYSSVGASGAVCGIIFASIALFPDMGVGFFFLPVYIPGWLYGLGYVLYSIYSIRSKKDNIGHESHLGGALVGLTAAVIMHPSSLVDNYLPILAIALPAIFFIYMIITRPHFLLIDNYYFKKHHQYVDIDHKYNADKADRQRQVDMILEKIHRHGMSSLTKKEKEILERYSQTMS